MMRIREFLLATSLLVPIAAPAWTQTATAADAIDRKPQSGASADAATGQSATTTQAQASPDAGLGDIIVTAQQRGESLQRAAIPVDVVKGSDLVASGVNTVDLINKLVPAITVQGTGSGNIIFIRGVGNFSLQTSSDPATAFNYDGIYVGRPLSTSGTFFDLQRVEVLKGPQGTLYGRNATAGAINVLPVQPELDQFGGYGIGTLGNYRTEAVEGAVNVPFGEDVALRLSGNYVHHSGYLSDGTSSEDAGGVRLQLKAALTPSLTVRLSGDFSHEGGTGLGGNYILKYALNPATGQYALTPANVRPSDGYFSPDAQSFIQTVTAGSAGRTLQPYSLYPYENNRFYGAHMQVDWNTPIGTVTLLPAWRETDKDNFQQPSFALGDRQTDIQYSVEARLVSSGNHLLDYNLGFYYFNETIDDAQAAGTQSAASFTGAHYYTASYAGYGRLTLHVTDRFRLTGGARYTDDDKHFNSSSQTLAEVCRLATGCPTAPLLPYTNTLAQQPFLPAASGGVVLSGGGAVVARVDSASAAALSKGKVTWRAAVEYDLAPRSLAYASVETGYRSGGFNTAVGFLTYAPETITAYTIGFKNRFLDNRLQLNLEGFDWEYRNQQLGVIGLDATGRATAFTRNIGQATIRGGEAELVAQVTPQTIFSADVQYLDAFYKSFLYKAPVSGGVPFTGCAVAADPSSTTLRDVNCTGKQAFNAPRWTINAGIQHTIPIGRNILVLSANTQYRGSRYTSFDYVPAEKTGSTTQSDAQISYGTRDGKWSVAMFVHNLENDRFLIFAITGVQANILSGEYSEPRTFGARLSTKF